VYANQSLKQFENWSHHFFDQRKHANVDKLCADQVSRLNLAVFANFESTRNQSSGTKNPISPAFQIRPITAPCLSKDTKRRVITQRAKTHVLSSTRSPINQDSPIFV
jgi:hypothetical protein